MKIKTISAKRQRGLEFHIKNGDYFGTLATVLFLLQESMDGDTKKALQQFVWDLMFLQKHHQIIKRRHPR
jgi:hypothetical protein